MSKKSQRALEEMINALIKGDTAAATEKLHEAIQAKSRKIILGEEEDEKDSDDEDKEDEDKEEKDEDDEKSKDSDDEESDEDEDDEDEDEEDEDEDDEDEEVDESVKHHPEGAMSRKIHGNSLKDVPRKEKITKAKDGVEKHGNSSTYLDDAIKGVVKHKRYPKGKMPNKHPNDAPHLKPEYDEDCEGRDYDKGTGEV